MKKAVITGATGFVGNALVKCLVEKDIEITAIVRDGWKGRQLSDLYPNRIRIIECDLTDVGRLKRKLKDVKADAFYHLAWFGLKDNGLTDYRVQMSAVENTIQLIEVAAACDCKKFIGMGSITQYETIYYKHAMIEGDKHVVYKTAKLAAQLMGEEIAKEYEIEFIWPIITNIYGIGEKSDRLINTVIKKLLEGKEMPLTEGSQNYDFVYISDACEALYLLGEYGKNHTEYVIGSGQIRKLKDWLLICEDVLNSKGKLLFGERKNKGYSLPEACFGIGTLFHDTGFVPKIGFAEGIKKTSDWLNEEQIHESYY